MRQAASLFAEQGETGEEAVCLSLLGLLWSETSKPERSLEPLSAAALLGGTPHHPWLALWCGFLRAFHLAGVGACSEGRAVLEKTMDLYCRTRHDADVLRAYRLEGAARARLGELGQGEALLEAVRRKQIQRRNVPEAALASLAQAAVLAIQGRAGKIARLTAEIQAAAFAAEEGSVFAVEALELCGSDLAEGVDPWLSAAQAGAEFLRLCRRFDVRLERVPFYA